MASETELKLWLHPGDVEAFRALARFRRAQPHAQALRTIYFDTPDFKLAGHGIALRVRRIGRRWVQTLKTEGERSGGLSKRLELETAVAKPAPDFSQLPAQVTDKLIRQKWRRALVPVYETRFLRTAWNLRTPGGGRVEVALDVGEIVAGKKSAPLCEVELELKSGPVQALYALARVLARQVLLIPFDASKAERGARLAVGMPNQAAVAVMPKIDKSMPLCTAFAAVARASLSQLQANLPGLLTSADPEYLHQARVALRRLRSAVSLFGKRCPPPAAEMARVASLARALGEARDWDVFVLGTLPWLLESMPPPQTALLVRRAHAARRAARRTALDLASQPQTALDVLALHQWLDSLATGQGRHALDRYAAGKLARLHGSVLVAARGAAEQSPEQRHALRIRVKRLRYALDYLGGLFGGHGKFVALFARLQDTLGELNDAHSALRFLGQLNADGRMDELVAKLVRRVDERSQGRIDETDRMLKKFASLAPPWQRAAKP